MWTIPHTQRGCASSTYIQFHNIRFQAAYRTSSKEKRKWRSPPRMVGAWRVPNGDAIILEDAIELSPHWYTWLKAAWASYDSVKIMAGMSLQRRTLIPMKPSKSQDLVQYKEVGFSFQRCSCHINIVYLLGSSVLSKVLHTLVGDVIEHYCFDDDGLMPN